MKVNGGTSTMKVGVSTAYRMKYFLKLVLTEYH